MRAKAQLIRIRLGMLSLAAKLQNVSLACKIAGVSRSHFYRIKKAYDTLGQDGLAPSLTQPTRGSFHIPPEVEHVVLMMTEHYPTIACPGLVTRLGLDGISVSPAMVHLVWKKHGLTRRASRVAWMGRQRAERHSLEVDPEGSASSSSARSELCDADRHLPVS